jgi:sugar lactone lactonase YvrE
VKQQRMARREVLFDGLRFPEGCRWHDGRLWFSDMHTGTLYSADPDTADLRIEFVVDARLSGMDWLPDGTLVVSSMLDRLILRRAPGGDVETHADLSSVTPHPINDLVVDRTGRIIVGGFGYDLYGGAEQVPGPLIGVAPDGAVEVLVDDLVFPNGMVLLSDGTLVVAETWGARLSAFDIGSSGALEHRRIWAELPEGSTPDGICVDADDAVWVSSILDGRFLRVREGGQVDATVELNGRLAVDCILTGADGRTLLMSTANSFQPDETVGRLGRIERLRIEASTA